ncbi:beta-glucosidase 2 [Stagonosporopsis vannaccii]|nr:beta-glucosidase 2 [Stagonosporopsis vannaccii]
MGPDAWQADFTESQLIDYRHFGSFNITPLYESGCGLSYTSFALEGSLDVERATLKISAKPSAHVEVLPGGNIELWQSILRLRTALKNTGNVAGATVLQLYVVFPADTMPDRGFQKMCLQPGETGTATFELLRKSVIFWDVQSQAWVIPVGNFEFRGGFSSRNIVDIVSHAVLEWTVGYGAVS